MIELYIDKVVRVISIDKKDEVEDKLRKRIYKLLDGREDQASIDEVLEYLGDPHLVANEYENTQYLIGPQIYKSYTKVLKIMTKVVLTVTIASNVVALIVVSLLSFKFKTQILNILSLVPTLISTLLYMAVFVTIFFVVVERYMKDETKIIIEYISNFQFKNLWNEIKDRYEKREDRGYFSRISSLAHLVIGIVLLTISIFSGFFLKRGLIDQAIIDYDLFELNQRLLNILFIVYIAFNGLKLIYKKWDTFFVFINAAVNTFTVYVFWVLYQANGLVNQAYLDGAEFVVFGTKFYLSEVWSELLFIIYIVIVIFAVVNSLLGIYHMVAQNVRLRRRREADLEETQTELQLFKAAKDDEKVEMFLKSKKIFSESDLKKLTKTELKALEKQNGTSDRSKWQLVEKKDNLIDVEIGEDDK